MDKSLHQDQESRCESRSLKNARECNKHFQLKMVDEKVSTTRRQDLQACVLDTAVPRLPDLFSMRWTNV